MNWNASAISTVILILLLMLAGCGSGNLSTLEPLDYHPDQDVYIVFRGLIIKEATSILPVAVVGRVVFKLQEGTHAKITHVSKAKINYYYIWVCLEDACIPVDPFTFNE